VARLVYTVAFEKFIADMADLVAPHGVAWLTTSRATNRGVTWGSVPALGVPAIV
jgi:hypothetical protein